MKKFIINTIVFLGFIYIAFFILSRYDNINKDKSNHPNILRVREASKADSLDVLFVGNSYCYSSINPRSFDEEGKEVFNLGISTAGPGMYKLLIEDYLKSCSQKPKIIACGYSYVTFTHGSDNWSKYPIHRYLNKPVSHEEIAIKYIDLKLYFSLLYQAGKKGFTNIFMEEIGENKKVNLYKGYSNDTIRVSKEKLKKDHHLYKVYNEDDFDNSKFEEMISLGNFCKSEGIEIVFFEIPSFKFPNFISDEFKGEYEKSKAIIADKGFRLIEISIPQKAENYINTDHMNSFGANLYTSKLIHEI